VTKHWNGGTWWRTEQVGSHPDSWVDRHCLERAGIRCLGWRVLLFGPRMAMIRRCECGLWNDEFHEPAEDAGSSSRGHCWGRQCPRDDHRPCFSHRVSSARGVTSVHISTSTTWCHDNGNWQRISWVCLHPIPNSFQPRKASLVRIRSWINYKRPILIQWLPVMLRSVAAPYLNYVWTRFC